MVFGLSSFSSVPLTLAYPSAKTYSKVTFKGISTVDNAHLQRVELTSSQMTTASQSQQQFGANTIFLFDFENNYEGGNYTALAAPIASYNIKRKKPDDLLYTLIDTVTQGSLTEFKDMSAKNKFTYDYAVYPVAATPLAGIEGQPILGSGELDFFGWILSDIDNTTSYKFDMEIESDSIKTTQDMKLIDTYTQYPVSSFGLRKYDRGRLNTMPYSLSVDGLTYTIDITLLTALKTFINDRQMKILRNTLGNIWKVVTDQFDYKYEDKIADQPYRISFEFTEVANSDT
jgi:hypothetical protein